MRTYRCIVSREWGEGGTRSETQVGRGNRHHYLRNEDVCVHIHPLKRIRIGTMCEFKCLTPGREVSLLPLPISEVDEYLHATRVVTRKIEC